MTQEAVIRFHKDGPPETGLEEWEEMNPDDLVSGTPVQHGHTYHEIEEDGYLSGVWDCTAFTDHMTPYSVDEFMYLLEGSIIMRMPDGSEVHIKAGDAFVIPKGLECQWDQPEYVRKFFMILDGPVPDGGANPALRRVTVPDLTAGARPDDAVESNRVDFVNAAGTMQVAVSDHAQAVMPACPSEANKLIHVLQGQLSLTIDAGTETFAAGETAYIAQGSVVGWSTASGTRLLTSSYCRP